MDMALWKMMGIGGAFALILILGYTLSREGFPYNTFLFTLHKLIAVGLVVYLVVTVNRLHKAAPLTALESGVWVAAGVFFLLTIVTGGLLSVEKEFPKFVSLLHAAAPYLTVLSTGVGVWMVVG